MKFLKEFEKTIEDNLKSSKFWIGYLMFVMVIWSIYVISH